MNSKKFLSLKKSNCVYVRRREKKKESEKHEKEKFHCKNVMTIEHIISDAMANANMLEQKGFPLF